MRFPPGTVFEIPERKVKDYLLSDPHVVGMWKAQFLGSLGFGYENIPALQTALVELARKNEIVTTD